MLVLTVLGTLGCDRLSKAVAARLLAGSVRVEWLGGLVRLQLAENRGAFLGLGDRLPDGLRFTAFVAAIGLALAAAFGWLLFERRLAPRRSIAAAMMIGGGLANLLDRIPDGAVTDFLVVGAGPLRTGVFNVADAAILAGALLWIWPTPAGRSPESPSSGA
jgi:signal peptidase II